MSQYYYILVKIAQLLSRRPIKKKFSNYYVEWLIRVATGCLLNVMNCREIESFLHNVLQSFVAEDGQLMENCGKRTIINLQ